MLTGIHFLACDICKVTFSATSTGNLHPYDDFKCVKCNWKSTLCKSCGKKSCPKCGGELETTHKRLGKHFGGNVMF